MYLYIHLQHGVLMQQQKKWKNKPMEEGISRTCSVHAVNNWIFGRLPELHSMTICFHYHKLALTFSSASPPRTLCRGVGYVRPTWAVHGAAVLLSQRGRFWSKGGRDGASKSEWTAAAPSADTEAISAAIDQLQRFIAIVTALFLVGP